MFKRLFLLPFLFIPLVFSLVATEEDGFLASVHVFPGKSDAFIVVEWDLAKYPTCPGIHSIATKERPFYCPLDPVVFRYYVFYFDGRGYSMCLNFLTLILT